MKKALVVTLLTIVTLSLFAQQNKEPFRAYLYNKEYGVYLRINFYDQDVTVPGQELYGKLPGYLGKEMNSFCWVITSCEVKSDRKAVMQLINDFGSEDLTATLERKNDSIYILRQGKGSTIKVPHKGKWRKLPPTLEMKKR